jgi:hypothetical protein
LWVLRVSFAFVGPEAAYHTNLLAAHRIHFGFQVCADYDSGCQDRRDAVRGIDSFALVFRHSLDVHS